MTFFLRLTSLLCACSVTLAAAWGQAPSPVISVLEKDGSPLIAPGLKPAYLEVLSDLGLRVAFQHGEKPMPLTWERLRKYQMVIMPFAPEVNAFVPGADQEGVTELLDRYLREGGGILCLCPPLSAMKSEQDNYNSWLRQHGAQLDWATIGDDAHQFTNPPPVPWQKPFYLWTSNVAPSPITEGVKTLFFLNNVFRSPSMRPLTVSPEWQVLLSTEATAVTTELTAPIGAETMVQKIAGTEKTGARPLLAVRSVGKGRLALFGGSCAEFYFDLGKLVGGQVISKVGDGQRPSDWLPLLRNLAVWLSEPARAAGFPGGATDQGRFIINPQYGYRDPVNWEQPDLSVSDAEIYRLCTMHCGPWDAGQWRDMLGGRQRSFKFLVGAHTVRSGGRGTVADWRRAAQAAGFDGVVFRETILSMSKQQWEAFQEECKAASDDRFYAVPGWDWTDWEGNRFLMFNRDLPYFRAPRLAPDGKSVRDQEMWYFDAGWPANLPIFVKRNPNDFWNYRLYNAFPVTTYEKGKPVEDNRAEWISLQDRCEFPSPMAVHLLEDPAEVPAAVGGRHMMVIAPSLADIQTNPRWQSFSLGIGIDNTVAQYLSDGPIVDCFLPLNMYRTTLGSVQVPGSYRYRIYVRAHSAAPITLVELWGGGQCLRRYRPGAREFAVTIDEQHDRQRGLWLRIVDAQGKEALASKIGVHDKRFVFTWCGDHCNALPWGQGVDAQGDPVGVGIVTHPKSVFCPAGGPGVSHTEGAMYIPYGTDTSAPGLGIFGETTFTTAQGPSPAPNMHLVPDFRFLYGNRDMMIQRMAVDRWADTNKYNKDWYQYNGWISGWGPYFRTGPTPDFDIVADDLDFHHDLGQPAFQLCRGEIRFKREVTLSDTPGLNLTLGQLGWQTVQNGAYTAAGRLPQPGRLQASLGRGGYFTWPGDWGHGTIFALDDALFVNCALNDQGGSDRMRPAFGYALGARTFRPGDVFRYQFLIMRWPVGSTMADRLDAKVAAGLNLTDSDRGVRMTARQGTVTGTQFVLDLQAQGHVFRGELSESDLPCALPVRVAGLNENWTAGKWHRGVEVFAPIALDPDGFAWLQLDPVKDAGEIFLGNVLTCGNPAILLRAFQRSDGQWEILAHNPTDKAARLTVQGTPGGPLGRVKREISLQPGEETRWVTR